jgi:hypothetical protein
MWGTIGFYTPPAYCRQCGQAFPWTEAKTQAATELLVEELNCSAEQAAEVKRDILDAVQQTPRAEVAASRLKKAFAALSSGAGKIMQSTLGGILSEAIKRQIWAP